MVASAKSWAELLQAIFKGIHFQVQVRLALPAMTYLYLKMNPLQTQSNTTDLSKYSIFKIT